MNPDDFEPREHTYPEWEKEVTLDGVDYLVIGEPTEERFPVEKDGGGYGTGYAYSFESIQVLTVVTDGHDCWYDYDSPLSGDALAAFMAKHGDALAKQACEEQQDKAIAEAERRMWGD